MKTNILEDTNNSVYLEFINCSAFGVVTFTYTFDKRYLLGIQNLIERFLVLMFFKKPVSLYNKNASLDVSYSGSDRVNFHDKDGATGFDLNFNELREFLSTLKKIKR